jgi:hypothetical protein
MKINKNVYLPSSLAVNATSIWSASGFRIFTFNLPLGDNTSAFSEPKM